MGGMLWPSELELELTRRFLLKLRFRNLELAMS